MNGTYFVVLTWVEDPDPLRHFFTLLSRVADPDPDWIRIQSGQWIRIQEGKNVPQKKKKISKSSSFAVWDGLF
jgi:hypothetical protein